MLPKPDCSGVALLSFLCALTVSDPPLSGKAACVQIAAEEVPSTMQVFAGGSKLEPVLAWPRKGGGCPGRL